MDPPVLAPPDLEHLATWATVVYRVAPLSTIILGIFLAGLGLGWWARGRIFRDAERLRTLK